MYFYSAIFVCLPQTLDIQIVYIFLNELNLDKKFDDDKDHKVWRTEWVKKVDQFRPTIERILNNVEESGESEQQHGPVCRQFYQTCMWEIISI